MAFAIRRIRGCTVGVKWSDGFPKSLVGGRDLVEYPSSPCSVVFSPPSIVVLEASPQSKGHPESNCHRHGMQNGDVDQRGPWMQGSRNINTVHSRCMGAPVRAGAPCREIAARTQILRVGFSKLLFLPEFGRYFGAAGIHVRHQFGY